MEWGWVAGVGSRAGRASEGGGRSEGEVEDATVAKEAPWCVVCAGTARAGLGGGGGNTLPAFVGAGRSAGRVETGIGLDAEGGVVVGVRVGVNVGLKVGTEAGGLWDERGGKATVECSNGAAGATPVQPLASVTTVEVATD